MELEKQLRQRSSSISYETNQHGCMGGVIHLFNFPRRFRPRRLLTDRRHRKHRDASGFKNAKINEDDPSKVEEHGLMDGEFNYIFGDANAIKKIHVGAPKGGSKTIPSAMRLTRTLSIHHWECNDYVEKTSEDTSPASAQLKSLNDEEDADVENQTTETKDSDLMKQTSNSEEEQGITKDIATSAQNQSPDSVLTKCGSYPGARSNTMFSGIKFVRKDNRQSINQDEKSQLLGKESAVPIKISSPSSTDSRNQDKEEVTSKENMKQKYRISLDGILHKIPYGQKIPQVLMVERTPGPDKSSKPNFGRSRSLSESVDRYSLLLESNKGKESKRNIFNRSKSVHNDGSFPYMHCRKTFGRLISIRESEPHLPQKNTEPEASNGLSLLQSSVTNLSIFEEEKIKGGLGSSKKVAEHTGCVDDQSQCLGDANVENVLNVDTVIRGQETTGVEGDACEKCDLPYEMLERIVEVDPQLDIGYNGESQISPPNPDSHFKEDLVEHATSNLSLFEENLDFKPEWREVAQSSSQVQDIDNSLYLDFDLHSELNQMESKMDDDFNYVKEILKKSGLSGHALSDALNSSEQPVLFSVFEELEGYKCLLDVDIYVPDINLDHLLLFDLINEVLLEKSNSTLSPWISCFGYCIPRVATESQVLKEVWESINWHCNHQSELKFSLENTIARDLSKNDQWMDLKYQTKIIRQELESLILDELIDEAISLA